MVARRSDHTPTQAAHGTPQGEKARRSAESGTDHDATVSAEIAAEVGEATKQLAARLANPDIAHTVEDIEAITQGLATTVAGAADGVTAMTAWMRTAGHGGALSGHTSVVADRLAHAGDELARLTQAVGQAARPAS